MKIAILAAGSSLYFPLFFDKPKCLYHFGGRVQLSRVIDVARKFVDEKDIIVLGGYKYKYIKKFLDKYYPDVEYRVNANYDGPAIYSFRKAIEDVQDDVIIMFGDENISEYNVRRIAESKRSLAVLCHDNYYYYSLGIMKICQEHLHYLFDDNYLSMDYMKKVYCFANNKEVYDGTFAICSGICIGYIMIDIIRKVGNIQKIENPVHYYKGDEIDFLHYNPEKEYIDDIDHYSNTDEYKQNWFMRFYSDCISDNIKRVVWKIKKIVKK